jgi:hypothetical protein
VSDVIRRAVGRTDLQGAATSSTGEQTRHPALLDAICQPPGCRLRNGAHSPDETVACIERWLLALYGRETQL